MAKKMRGEKRGMAGNPFTDVLKSSVDARGRGLAGGAARTISGRQSQIDAQLERMYRGQSTDSRN